MERRRGLTILGGLALVMTCLIVLPGQTQATPPGGVVGTPLVQGFVHRRTSVGSSSSPFQRSNHRGRRQGCLTGRLPRLHLRARREHGLALASWSPSSSWSRAEVAPRTTRAQVLALGRVYPTGTAFLSTRGTGAPTSLGNESGVTTQTSVVYFGVPEGASPRIDEPAPGNKELLTTGATAPIRANSWSDGGAGPRLVPVRSSADQVNGRRPQAAYRRTSLTTPTPTPEGRAARGVGVANDTPPTPLPRSTA